MITVELTGQQAQLIENALRVYGAAKPFGTVRAQVIDTVAVIAQAKAEVQD